MTSETPLASRKVLKCAGTGMFVPPGDGRGLSVAVLRLATHRARSGRLGTTRSERVWDYSVAHGAACGIMRVNRHLLSSWQRLRCAHLVD